MRAHYDEQVDAFSIRLDESAVIESEEVRPGLIFDFDENDEVVGIEILGFRKRRPSSNPTEMRFEVFGTTDSRASA